MKILFYSDQFCAHTTTFIYNDVMGLSTSHQVKYVCLERTNPEKFPFPDVEVIPFPQNRLVRRMMYEAEIRGWYLDFRNRAFAASVKNAIEHFAPDIIQVNFGYEGLRLLDNYPKGNKTPVVINFLGHDASFHLKRKSYVDKLKQIAALPYVYATCNAVFLRNQLEAKGIFFQQNQIVRSGADTNFFTRTNSDYPDPNIFSFIQIASLQPQKGQDITIQAFARLQELIPAKETLLILVGGAVGGTYTREKLEELAKSMGVGNKVRFIDWVTPAEAKEWMCKAHCFVQHSLTYLEQTEGVPVAISEAMALKMPILSTKHAGIPELVEDGVNGYLVEEGDVEHYAQRMKNMMDWGLQDQNREKVVRDFNIENRVEIFNQYYQDILAEEAVEKGHRKE